MEITDSLSNDIKDAPDWFHNAISKPLRKENHESDKFNLLQWEETIISS